MWYACICNIILVGNHWQLGDDGDALYARLVHTNAVLEELHLPCTFLSNVMLSNAVESNFTLHKLSGCSFTLVHQQRIDAALSRNSTILWHKMQPLLLDAVLVLLPLRVGEGRLSVCVNAVADASLCIIMDY